MLPWLTAIDSSPCLHVLVYSSKCARAVLCFLCCDWRSRVQDWNREVQEGGSSQGCPVRSGGPSASCGKSEFCPAWNTRLEFSSHLKLISLQWVGLLGPFFLSRVILVCPGWTLTLYLAAGHRFVTFLDGRHRLFQTRGSVAGPQMMVWKLVCLIIVTC